MCGQEETELDFEKLTGSNLGKEYVNAVYYHLAYLTYMYSISCEMPGWKIHNLGIRLPGETSRPQICRFYHSKSKTKEKLESTDEGERGEQKNWLKM